MIAQLIILPVLCGVVVLASYLHWLYVESLRFRPRGTSRSYEVFEQQIRGRLTLEPQEALRRFSAARQVALIVVALDLVLLTFPGADLHLALLEVLVLSVVALVVFAHMIPSILVMRTAGAWAVPFVPAARIIATAIKPVTLLALFVSSLAELGAEEPAPDKPANPSDEIEALLDAGQEEGLIEEEDRKLIQSVVEFGDKTVREAMTPRPDVVSIDAGNSVEDLRQLFINREYSRIPVYEGTIDQIIGFVHSRDTLELDATNGRGKQVRDLVRPLPLVPETKPIRELLREMQESNQQMSVVIDEYGQTAGLATMEDLMEEIVGEIRDESEESTDVLTQSDNSFVVPGSMDLDRLEELVGFRPDEEFESTTVGGLVCEQLGKVPGPGAKLALDGIRLEVLAADERRVDSVRLWRVRDTPERDGGDTDEADTDEAGQAKAQAPESKAAPKTKSREEED